MTTGFLQQIKAIPDHRIAGMVTYPLDEILLATLVGVLCGAEDWDAAKLLSREYLAWLRQFLPYKPGIPQAQTFRKVFRLLKPEALEPCFAAWAASLQDIVRGVVALDGKTLRGSKQAADGSGALHLLSAYACAAGLVIGQRAVDGKSNEITAIPELLQTLAIKGAIVAIGAMGTQTAIAAQIVAQDADYVLALKGNQSLLHEDVKLCFEDAGLTKTCPLHTTTDAGHGRVEERDCRLAEAGWPSAIPAGRSCAASPPSRPGAATRRPAKPLSKRAITSPRFPPIRPPFLPPRAPIGGSRTISTGSSTSLSTRIAAGQQRTSHP